MDSLRPWLAHPEALWLLTVLPLLVLLGAMAWYRRRRALTRLASSSALQGLALTRPRIRRLRALCFTTGLLLLIAGIAGPQWGIDKSQAVASGRDLVVVLDLSRSMLAEQPSRQEWAQRALHGLVDSLQKRGGHRIALVVFAARAKLVCPLTHDYNHFRDALAQQDADNLPLELRLEADNPSSGTRIGAGLRAALAALDPLLAGYQDILLVSDGDDPAEDSVAEWAEGAELARSMKVPVYTLGVGNPVEFSRILVEGKALTYNNRPIRSRLEEEPLQEIARRTGGNYIAARTYTLPPGRLYQEVFSSRVTRENSEAPLPAYHPRYAWFLGPALALFVLTTLIRERRHSTAGTRRSAFGFGRKPSAGRRQLAAGSRQRTEELTTLGAKETT